MTEKQRSTYQQEMDRIHVPKEKAEETLRMMLEENRRLREKEAEKKTGNKTSRRILVYGGAITAAVLILIIGLSANHSVKYQFSHVSLDTIMPSYVSQGIEPTAAGPDSGFKAAPEFLFPGWDVVSDSTEKFGQESETDRGNRFTVKKGNHELTVTVTGFEPDVFKAVQQEQQIAGKTVRLALNQETGTYAAAWRQDNQYYVLTGQTTEKEFIEAVREILSQK